MQIELTSKEAKILGDYLLRKTRYLEESGLQDSDCCIAMNSILFKLYRGAKK